MSQKPSFEQIFKLTGTHLAAGMLGFLVAVLLFAPKPRVPHLEPRAAQVLELAGKARAAASASSGPALREAVELCQKLAWPACDPDSVRQMGRPP